MPTAYLWTRINATVRERANPGDLYLPGVVLLAVRVMSHCLAIAPHFRCKENNYAI